MNIALKRKLITPRESEFHTLIVRESATDVFNSIAGRGA